MKTNTKKGLAVIVGLGVVALAWIHRRRKKCTDAHRISVKSNGGSESLDTEVNQTATVVSGMDTSVSDNDVWLSIFLQHEQDPSLQENGMPLDSGLMDFTKLAEWWPDNRFTGAFTELERRE